MVFSVIAAMQAGCNQQKTTDPTEPGPTVMELVGAAAGAAAGGGAEAAQPVDPAYAAAQKDFLDKNAKAPGVTVLPSGLQYKVVKSGPATGTPARRGDQARVHYTGTLSDGTPFESTRDAGEPAVFTVGEMVPGFDEALQLMKPGDEWFLYIPSSLGYGDRTNGPIPGGSVLVFKMEVLDVLPAGGPDTLG